MATDFFQEKIDELQEKKSFSSIDLETDIFGNKRNLPTNVGISKDEDFFDKEINRLLSGEDKENAIKFLDIRAIIFF